MCVWKESDDRIDSYIIIGGNNIYLVEQNLTFLFLLAGGSSDWPSTYWFQKNMIVHANIFSNTYIG